MYLTGTPITLEKRIHQLAVNSGDINQFTTEMNTYTGTASIADINRWQKEIEKKNSILGL